MRVFSSRSFRFFIFIVSAICLVSPIFQGQAQNGSETKAPDVLLRDGKLLEAKQALTLALRQRPDSVKDLILLTRVLLIEDEFDEAKTQIRRAIKLEPTNPEALALYGHCLFREGSF